MTLSTNQDSRRARAPTPKLAAPGAGLPLPELLIGRLIFHTKRRLTSPTDNVKTISQECASILQLVRSCSEEFAGEQILINRPRGLEDSSRFWSVYMTLDHLRIVNLSISGVIHELCLNQMPEGTASTAAVKPALNVGPEVLHAFEESCAAVQRTAAAHSNLKMKLRYAHPWFGLLDAAGWLAICAMHMGLHRQQIKMILKECSSTTTFENIPR